jgi:hypothetical protein
MNMRKGILAAVGAALLTAGTGAAAFAIQDGNVSGTATNSGTATGGTASPSVSPTFGNVTSGITATGSVVSHSHQGGTKASQKNGNKSGSANADNHGTAKSGSQRFRI